MLSCTNQQPEKPKPCGRFSTRTSSSSWKHGRCQDSPLWWQGLLGCSWTAALSLSDPRVAEQLVASLCWFLGVLTSSLYIRDRWLRYFSGCCGARSRWRCRKKVLVAVLDRGTGWEVWSRVSTWVLLVHQIAFAIRGPCPSSIGTWFWEGRSGKVLSEVSFDVHLGWCVWVSVCRFFGFVLGGNRFLQLNDAKVKFRVCCCFASSSRPCGAVDTLSPSST